MQQCCILFPRVEKAFEIVCMARRKWLKKWLTVGVRKLTEHEACSASENLNWIWNVLSCLGRPSHFAVWVMFARDIYYPFRLHLYYIGTRSYYHTLSESYRIQKPECIWPSVALITYPLDHSWSFRLSISTLNDIFQSFFLVPKWSASLRASSWKATILHTAG